MSTLHSPSPPVGHTMDTGARLFSPLEIRDVVLSNRIVMSPMCQYSAEDGFANDWHLVHLGSRVIGGAGAVIVEATAVEERGRISPVDLGIWKDQHIEPLLRITRFCREYGTVPSIQLAHAGRKASTEAPWNGGGLIQESEGGWPTIAPSPIPFTAGNAAPAEMSIAEIHGLVDSFAKAAERALAAGFEIIELHGAHGYLIHEFLSPLSNKRADQYGGSFENRIRFAAEVIQAVRRVWPERLPLFLRISATDWVEGGWTANDSVRLVRALAPLGVDLVDCSSGGLVPDARIPVGPGYQVQFAEQIRKETGVLTAAVGMITDAHQAESILEEGAADLVVLAREFLREPYWPVKAAESLGVATNIPVQYQRAFSSKNRR